MSASNKPRVRAYIGATGSGKGVSVRDYLRESAPSRLLVWDPQGEWSELGRVHSTLAGAIDAMRAESFRIVYSPGEDASVYPARFALWCRAAYAAGNLTAMVGELSDVTSAQSAPLPWTRLTKSGRHRGLEVIADTQRPAIVDKTFLGNCTYIRCFALREETDKRRMASALGVAYEQIAGLETTETETATTIRFYERDFRTGERGEKAITLRRPRARAT